MPIGRFGESEPTITDYWIKDKLARDLDALGDRPFFLGTGLEETSVPELVPDMSDETLDDRPLLVDVALRHHPLEVCRSVGKVTESCPGDFGSEGDWQLMRTGMEVLRRLETLRDSRWGQWNGATHPERLYSIDQAEAREVFRCQNQSCAHILGNALLISVPNSEYDYLQALSRNRGIPIAIGCLVTLAAGLSQSTAWVPTEDRLIFVRMVYDFVLHMENFIFSPPIGEWNDFLRDS